MDQSVSSFVFFVAFCKKISPEFPYVNSIGANPPRRRRTEADLWKMLRETGASTSSFLEITK